MIKKILLVFLVAISFIGSTPAYAQANDSISNHVTGTSVITPYANVPGGGGGYPYEGAKKVERIYITSANLMTVGGLPAAGAQVSSTALKKAVLAKLGSFHPIVRGLGGLLFLSGSYPALTGYKGYKITLTYTYVKNKRVFDGTHWVTYTGWGVPRHSVTRYR